MAKSYIGSTGIKKIFNLIKSKFRLTPYKYYNITLNTNLTGDLSISSIDIINDVLYYYQMIYKSTSVEINKPVKFGTISNLDDLKSRFNLKKFSFEIQGSVIASNDTTNSHTYCLKIINGSSDINFYSQYVGDHGILNDDSKCYILFSIALPLQKMR